MPSILKPDIHFLGNVEYEPTWKKMQSYALERTEDAKDQLWFLEHPPVFTQGMNGKAEHLLMPGDIPVIPIDRGGQVTYHGPGQLVVYPLLSLERLKLGPRDLVCALEKALINTIAEYGLEAYGKRDAPGVYVEERKIASIGLRIKKNNTYHGIALNVNMDKEPFSRINPCGYQGLVMTDIATELQASEKDISNYDLSIETVSKKLGPHMIEQLGY